MARSSASAKEDHRASGAQPHPLLEASGHCIRLWKQPKAVDFFSEQGSPNHHGVQQCTETDEVRTDGLGPSRLSAVLNAPVVCQQDSRARGWPRNMLHPLRAGREAVNPGTSLLLLLERRGHQPRNNRGCFRRGGKARDTSKGCTGLWLTSERLLASATVPSPSPRDRPNGLLCPSAWLPDHGNKGMVSPCHR